MVNTTFYLFIPQFSWIENFALADNNDLCLLENYSVGFNDKGPSIELYNFAYTNFKNLAVDYLTKAKPISENILKDPQISSSTSNKILEFKANLTKFEENYASCDGFEDLFNLADLYSNTTSFYYELEDEASSEEDTKIILNILKQYGSEDLDNEYYDDFNEFSKNFHNKFDDLEEDLKKEDYRESRMILKWYPEFKNLKSYWDILDSFDEFFDIFEEEEEEEEQQK